MRTEKRFFKKNKKSLDLPDKCLYRSLVEMISMLEPADFDCKNAVAVVENPLR
jgi:hypothetical protein